MARIVAANGSNAQHGKNNVNSVVVATIWRRRGVSLNISIVRRGNNYVKETLWRRKA